MFKIVFSKSREQIPRLTPLAFSTSGLSIHYLCSSIFGHYIGSFIKISTSTINSIPQ